MHAGARGIYWQHNHALFGDRRVRLALTLAINRREMLRVLNLPEILPLFDGPLTPQQYRRRQLPEPIPHDLVQARALLSAAGWHDVDGDGVRERQGQSFRFTALAPIQPLFQKLPEYIQAQLRHAGVDMQILPMDLLVCWERLNAGEFDAAFMVVQNGPRWYQQYVGEDSPAGYNNPQVKTLLDQAIATADPDEQDRIHRELMSIFRVEQPITYLGPATRTFVAHRRIKGLSSPFRADATQIMEDLWLEDED